MQTGFVLFDIPQSPSAGWASIAGEEPFRLKGIGDLDTGVKWITNLDWGQSRDAGIMGHPAFRRNDFFRTKFEDKGACIAKEMGLVDSDPEAKVAALAEVADRVNRLATKYYGFNLETAGDTLTASMRELLLNQKDPAKFGSDDFELACHNAYQVIQKCTARLKGSKIMHFRWPRLMYAQKMLEFPVPIGKWTLLDKKFIPEKREQRNNWLMDMVFELPAICKIRVSNVSEEVAQVLSFSSGSPGRGAGGAAIQRSWASIHEVCQFIPFADVDVEAIYVAESYANIHDLVRSPLLEEGVAGETSISAGIMAENYWVSLALDEKRFGQHIISPRAVWVRAWDRVMSFKAAWEFAEAGIQSFMYGYGGVWAVLQPGDYEDALEVAEKQGLIVPRTLLELMDEDERLNG